MTGRVWSRRLAALTVAGLVVAGCNGDSRRDAADAPTSTTLAAAPGLEGATTTLAPTLPGGAPADPGGAPASTIAPVGASPSTPGSTPATGAGGASGGGTGTVPAPAGGGASPAPSSPAPAEPAPAPGPGGTGSSTGATPGPGGSESPLPSIAATAEECAALNQVLAIVDHPDLRRLKAQTGC